MWKALIIDDNEDSRQVLQKDLERHCPEIQIVGQAGGVMEAAKFLKNNRIDVAFIDIQMGDGTGFDLLDIIPDIDFYIIFVTAYDNFAVKAFKYDAIDYLLKPIDTDDLKKAVKKLTSHRSINQDAGNNAMISLHSQDKIQIVKIADIVRCESKDNYTLFYLKDGSKQLISKTLKAFEEQLSDKNFLRVHHSHLVNPEYILEFQKQHDSLILKDHSEIPVSVRKRKIILDWLSGM